MSACSGQPAAPAPSAKAAAAGSPAALPAGATLLATLRKPVARYPHPAATAAGLVPATWYGARSTLPVVATRPGWTAPRRWRPGWQVRLAQRPNGSTAWVPASDVSLSTTPYRIVINLATTHLTLYKDNRMVFSAPGRTQKSGEVFVYVNDAVIGIHGPLGSDKEIGSTGARISHGCIRPHENDLLKLRDVPPGSPVDIVG